MSTENIRLIRDGHIYVLELIFSIYMPQATATQCCGDKQGDLFHSAGLGQHRELPKPKLMQAKCSERICKKMTVNRPWKVEIRSRKKFLAAGEACVATFWPTPYILTYSRLKGGTFVSSGFLTEGDLHFGIICTPLLEEIVTCKEGPWKSGSEREGVGHHALSSGITILTIQPTERQWFFLSGKTNMFKLFN